MKSLLLTAVASLLVLSGCSTNAQCEAVCKNANACGPSTTHPNQIDCPEFCNDVSQMHARGAACEEQFDAYTSCWDTNSAQACNASFTGCQGMADAWTTCMDDYCNANSDDPSCTCAAYADDDPATEDVDESETCVAYTSVYFTWESLFL
ncbi:MAG: hypothetical protein L0Y66_19820 [Myxococcaceae bacterium]|nr:hypothetical protein [Myxococcaceae bacterium]